jgi:hypothetical protein
MVFSGSCIPKYQSKAFLDMVVNFKYIGTCGNEETTLNVSKHQINTHNEQILLFLLKLTIIDCTEPISSTCKRHSGLPWLYFMEDLSCRVFTSLNLEQCP